MNETTVPPPVPQSKISALAVRSLVLGILSLVCFSIFSGIPSIICGHMALSEIKKSSGGLSGRALAIAGLTISYISTVLTVVGIIILLTMHAKVHE